MNNNNVAINNNGAVQRAQNIAANNGNGIDANPGNPAPPPDGGQGNLAQVGAGNPDTQNIVATHQPVTTNNIQEGQPPRDLNLLKQALAEQPHKLNVLKAGEEIYGQTNAQYIGEVLLKDNANSPQDMLAYANRLQESNTPRDVFAGVLLSTLCSRFAIDNPKMPGEAWGDLGTVLDILHENRNNLTGEWTMPDNIATEQRQAGVVIAVRRGWIPNDQRQALCDKLNVETTQAMECRADGQPNYHGLPGTLDGFAQTLNDELTNNRGNGIKALGESLGTGYTIENNIVLKHLDPGHKAIDFIEKKAVRQKEMAPPTADLSDFCLGSPSEDGKVVGANGEVLSDGYYMFVVTPEGEPRYMQAANDVGEGGNKKCFAQFVPHSQLANQGPVAAAGNFRIIEGKFAWVDNGSGHYRINSEINEGGVRWALGSLGYELPDDVQFRNFADERRTEEFTENNTKIPKFNARSIAGSYFGFDGDRPNLSSREIGALTALSPREGHTLAGILSRLQTDELKHLATAGFEINGTASGGLIGNAIVNSEQSGKLLTTIVDELKASTTLKDKTTAVLLQNLIHKFAEQQGQLPSKAWQDLGEALKFIGEIGKTGGAQQPPQEIQGQQWQAATLIAIRRGTISNEYQFNTLKEQLAQSEITINNTPAIKHELAIQGGTKTGTAETPDYKTQESLVDYTERLNQDVWKMFTDGVKEADFGKWTGSYTLNEDTGMLLKGFDNGHLFVDTLQAKASRLDSMYQPGPEVKDFCLGSPQGDSNEVVGANGEVLTDGYYMFVIDENMHLRYMPTANDVGEGGNKKPFSQYIPHSELSGMKSVFGAGNFRIVDGQFNWVDNGSGHYRVDGDVNKAGVTSALEALGYHLDGVELRDRGAGDDDAEYQDANMFVPKFETPDALYYTSFIVSGARPNAPRELEAMKKALGE